MAHDATRSDRGAYLHFALEGGNSMQRVEAVLLPKGSGTCSMARAFSAGLFTVQIEICALPPLNQKAIQGWGTQRFVNT
jgi:hypothetical protein